MRQGDPPGCSVARRNLLTQVEEPRLSRGNSGLRWRAGSGGRKKLAGASPRCPGPPRCPRSRLLPSTTARGGEEDDGEDCGVVQAGKGGRRKPLVPLLRALEECASRRDCGRVRARPEAKTTRRASSATSPGAGARAGMRRRAPLSSCCPRQPQRAGRDAGEGRRSRWLPVGLRHRAHHGEWP